MSFKSPHLVQRCNFCPESPKNARVSQQFAADYMGSSEFEYGAMSRSIRAIGANMHKMDIYKTDIVNEDGKRLWVFCANDVRAELIEWLEDRATTRSEMDCDYNGLQECLGFWCWFNPTDRSRHTNFWWEIEQHAAWGFEKASVQRFADAILVSTAIMDAVKAKSA